MGIFAYVKIGVVAAVILAGSYLVWDYQHRGRVIAAQQEQIAELEAAAKFYEAQPEIDRKTQEVKNEIDKAVAAGDVGRVRDLYRRLREHKRTGQGQAPAEADNGGDDD